MNNNIAFIFSHGPYGSSSGREGLDALLATMSLCEKVGVFFISDGVFLLLANQQPDKILTRNFVITFGLLKIYSTYDIYICADSIYKRGLKINYNWIFPIKCISSYKCRQNLSLYNKILTF